MEPDFNMGRLKSVDLRDTWKDEAADFTPWLAHEDNITLLGDTIGIDLEVEAQEKDVGRFQADILCKDTSAAGDHWILIENQLERTDHTHLGQLLTYAAGLDAVTIVWIAKQFTEEHRAALDWLNEIVADRVCFFGIEIELWSIGDSPTAPKFNVVCKPNDWTKPSAGLRSRFSQVLTETKKLQLEYWQVFRSVMEQSNGAVRPTKALPQHWQTFAIGRSRFLLYATLDTRNARIGVQLILQGEDAKAHFSLLRDQRDEIEIDAGEKFEWRELPDKKESQINLSRTNSDPSDRDLWPEQHKWLFDKLELFHKTFAARIKQLDASEARILDALHSADD